MGKHKRLIILGVVLLALIGLGVVFGTKWYRNYALRHVPGVIYSKKEIPIKTSAANTPLPGRSDFDSIEKNIKDKKWQEAADAAVAYGSNDANIIYLRISAFGYCVYAAGQNKNDSLAVDCREKGQLLISQLKAAGDRDEASKSFEAITKNQTYTPDNSSSQGATRG